MTEDLGNGQARAGDAVPRQRGGAHAAAKSSRFRRKSASVASESVPPAVPAPPAGAVPAPLPPRPRTAQEPPPTWSREPTTAPLPAIGPTRPGPSTTPAPTAGGTGSAGLSARVAAAVRSAAAGLCALAIVTTVVPLAVAQIPDAIAWSLPPRLAAAGPDAVTSLLRASGLALPAMARTAKPRFPSTSLSGTIILTLHQGQGFFEILDRGLGLVFAEARNAQVYQRRH